MSITALSARADEIARKAEALALQRISAVGGEAIAKALGVSEPTVSRLKNDDMRNVLLMLAVAGIKCVPAEIKCYDPKTIDYVLGLAKQRMAQIKNADELGESLTWED